MVKRLWRFFQSFPGVPVAGGQLGDRQAAQRIAPIARNFCRRAQNKAALAHQRMRNGEGRGVAGIGTAAPQDDVEIEYPTRPGLAGAVTARPGAT